MKDKLRGKFFIFSNAKSEKIKGLLESKIEGMSTLGFNSIMPIVKFKKDKLIPLNSFKVLCNLAIYIAISHIIVGIQWLKQCKKEDSKNFNSLFVKFVIIKEIVINDEENNFKCLCTYFTLGKKLIGVISYGYKQTEK